MKKIELQKVDSYRVQTKEGPVLFDLVSRWNGLMELKDDKGRKLILVPSESNGGFGEIFRNIFGSGFAEGAGRSSAALVMATPELATVLEWLPEPDASKPEGQT